MIIFLLVALLSSPLQSAFQVRESVDCIELNHYHDKQGKLVYDQIVFWKANPSDGRFVVRAWCMANDDCRPLTVNGIYKVVWRDGNLVRYVSSRLYRESWTQIDPERENKKHFDESSRISLAGRIREVDCE